MLLERIIPCLLIHDGGLHKTIRFKSPTYIGDPINAVKIFSDKEVDELVVVDIDATVTGRPPNFAMIGDLAAQAFMPVCYGGGVKTLREMEQLYNVGVEKVMLCSQALAEPRLVAEAARNFGSQGVTVCLDLKRPFLAQNYAVYSHRGSRRHPGTPLEVSRRFQELGAGELVLNNIDRDGTMQGYDHKLIKEISQDLSIPVVALGGAKDLADMHQAIHASGASAAAAGSLFSFRWPERAVLINYPKGRLATRA